MIVAVVARRDVRVGVRDRAAVGRIRRALDVDREAGAGGERPRAAAKDLAADGTADRAIGRSRHDRPVDAGRERVVDRDAEGRAGDTIGFDVTVTNTGTGTANPIVTPALTGPAGLAVLVMSMVAGATVKHSVVALVCFVARYCDAWSGVYSARQQYLPTAADVSPTV